MSLGMEELTHCSETDDTSIDTLRLTELEEEVQAERQKLRRSMSVRLESAEQERDLLREQVALLKRYVQQLEGQLASSTMETA